MNNDIVFISISTLATLGIVLILMSVFCVVCLCIALSTYITQHDKYDRIQRRNKFLRNRLTVAEHELYTLKFKEDLVKRDV